MSRVNFRRGKTKGYFIDAKSQQEEFPVCRKRESYLENPMPNFNFPPVSSSLGQPCQYLSIPHPADHKFHLLSNPHYDLQTAGALHPWPHPPARFSFSSNCLASSPCEACGSPANFLCSACKKVHYCTTRCQVELVNIYREFLLTLYLL